MHMLGGKEEVWTKGAAVIAALYQHGGILVQKAAEAFAPTADGQPDRV